MAASEEPPSKKRRLSIDLGENKSPVTFGAQNGTTTPVADALNIERNHYADEQRKEIRAGIITYVHPNEVGFSGVLKTRYTDFLVNELLPDGQVLHLTTVDPPTRSRKMDLNAKNETTDEISAEPADKEMASPPNEKAQTNSEVHSETLDIQEVQTKLSPIFGDQVTEKVIALHQAILRNPSKKPKDFRAVTSAAITDKEQRREAHQLIRQVFDSRLETKTSSNDSISISAAPKLPSARGGIAKNHGPSASNKLGWDELGGDYVHFSLYKENRDTMEALSFLASQLKVGPKNFQFGGTKDRRAVTVQRCSVYRIHAEQLAAIGKRLRGSKIGDFKYSRNGLELGLLGGNEFVITLRDCRFSGDESMIVEERVLNAQGRLKILVETFREGGFINYFGLQRFGSFATSTDEIGLQLLQGKLDSAVSKILDFDPAALDDSSELIPHDDKARARAIDIWNASQDSAKALEILPRKFSAESNIIRHLGLRQKKSGALSNTRDYQGALQSIPRNLRLMYLHAYQSLVWNTVASKRWEAYGAKVVEGDLILMSEDRSKQRLGTLGAETVDEQGEPIILPSASTGSEIDQPGESPYEQARPLSAEEATSGEYTIFDIVLPLPGYDVVYPRNDIGKEYKTFMASAKGGGLDPYNMRRSWKELSLSGSYRKLLGRPGQGMRFEVKTYERDDEQLVETDLDRLNKAQAQASDQVDEIERDLNTDKSAAEHVTPQPKVAVILWLKLSPSQYATMALRELMKAGVRPFKPEFGSAR